MPSRDELMERIRQLEEENSVLRDKLDLIYSIVAHEDDEEDEAPAGGLVQITGTDGGSGV